MPWFGFGAMYLQTDEGSMLDRVFAYEFPKSDPQIAEIENIGDVV